LEEDVNEKVYEKLRWVYDKYWESIDSIDEKTGIFLGIEIIVFTLFLQMLFSEKILNFLKQHMLFLILEGGVLTSLFISIVLSFISFKIESYKISPDPKTFWENFQKAAEENKTYKEKYEALLTSLNKNLTECCYQIENTKLKKIRLFHLSILLMLIGIFIEVIVFLFICIYILK